MRIFDKFAEYVLHSRFRAIVVTVFFLFFPVFKLLGWAILGLVTLRKGIVEGGIILAVAGLVFVGMGVVITTFPPPDMSGMMEQQAKFSAIWFNIAGFLLSSVWVWSFAIVLRQYVSWTKVLQAGLWSGVFIITSAHLIYPDLVVWWLPMVKDSLLELQKMVPDVQLPSIPEFSVHLAKIITGAQLAMVLLSSLLSLVLARWWQASLYNPGGLKQELLQIRLGLTEAGLLGVAALLALTDISVTGKAIAVDIAPVLGAIFVLAGMSLVHRFIAVMKKPWMGVCFFYGLIVILPFFYTVLLLVSLAVMDSWVNLSGRLIKR